MLIPPQRASREFMKSIAQAGLIQGFTVRMLSGTRRFAQTNRSFRKISARRSVWVIYSSSLAGAERCAEPDATHEVAYAHDIGCDPNPSG
jgi:hypothetical protein